MFDDYNIESNVLSSASGFPLIYGDRAYVSGIKSPVTPEQYLSTQHPRYLVYSDRGILRNWKELPPRCDAVSQDGVRFQCVYVNTYYRIYELTYP